MCLAKVYTNNLCSKLKRSVKYTNKFRGYKVYYDYGDGKLAMDRGSVKKRGWNTANDKLIGNKKYTSGFHIFSDIRDACSYAGYNMQDNIYLVEYKNIVAIGKNSKKNYGITVIAKQMKVIRKLTTLEVGHLSLLQKMEDEK